MEFLHTSVSSEICMIKISVFKCNIVKQQSPAKYYYDSLDGGLSQGLRSTEPKKSQLFGLVSSDFVNHNFGIQQFAAPPTL